jgi:hypothetical protein
LPEELQRRESRLKKIQQAKAELEKQAAEKAEQERAEAEAKLAALASKGPRLAENAEAIATGAVPLLNRPVAPARSGYA